MESKSYIEEIKRYLNRNLDKGYHLEDLKIQLRRNGYSQSAISRAVQEIEKERNAKKIEIKEETPKEETIKFVEPKKSGFFTKIRNLFKS